MEIRKSKDGARGVYIKRQKLDHAPRELDEREHAGRRALGHALKYTGKHQGRADGESAWRSWKRRFTGSAGCTRWAWLTTQLSAAPAIALSVRLLVQGLTDIKGSIPASAIEPEPVVPQVRKSVDVSSRFLVCADLSVEEGRTGGRGRSQTPGCPRPDFAGPRGAPQ